MDLELKAYLDNQFRVSREYTDEKFRETREDIDDKLRETREHIDDKLRETREYVREQVDASETRLLGEFWKWARTTDARYRQHHGEVNGLAERVGIVEDRVAELERRRNA